MPYAGIRTHPAFAMFSNLRVEGPRPNHWIMRRPSTSDEYFVPAEYARSLEIVYTDLPALRDLQECAKRPRTPSRVNDSSSPRAGQPGAAPATASARRNRRRRPRRSRAHLTPRVGAPISRYVAPIRRRARRGSPTHRRRRRGLLPPVPRDRRRRRERVPSRWRRANQRKRRVAGGAALTPSSDGAPIQSVGRGERPVAVPPLMRRARYNYFYDGRLGAYILRW